MRCIRGLCLWKLLVFCAAAFMGAENVSAEAVQIVGDANVVDGDTFDIGPVRIRIHGIDAPEAAQTCPTQSGQEWRCGTAATRRLVELIEGLRVTCIALERDNYGRIVARCLSPQGEDLAGVLTSEGLVTRI